MCQATEYKRKHYCLDDDDVNGDDDDGDKTITEGEHNWSLTIERCLGGQCGVVVKDVGL